MIRNLSLCGLLILTSTFAFAEDVVSVGSQFKIPKWQWVKLERDLEQKFFEKNLLRRKGDLCGIEVSGTVKVLSFSDDNQLAFVSYKAPGEDSIGTPCPSGSVFYVAVSKLEHFNQSYSSLMKEQAAFKADTLKILTGTSKLKELSGFKVGSRLTVPELEVVDTLLRKKSNALQMMKFDDRCKIEEDGVVQILGFSLDESMVLVSYQKPLKSQLQHACNTGAVFYLELSRLKSFGILNAQ